MRLFGAVVLGTVVASALAGQTLAADLIVDEPAAPVETASASDWAGAYLGVFGGYGTGLADDDASLCNNLCIDNDTGNDIDLEGYLLGVTAGVNFDLAEGLIAGVAADIAWANLTGEVTGTGPIFDFYEGTTHTIDWMGSVRGVLGFDGGTFMPYVTAGVAFAQSSRYSAPIDETVSATHTGWTAGAGVQIAISENAAIDLQYRHTALGEAEFDWAGPGSTREVGLTVDAITVGVNFSF